MNNELKAEAAQQIEFCARAERISQWGVAPRAVD
jgi:hypothetical protein